MPNTTCSASGISLRLEYPSLAIHAVLGDVSRRADIHSACLTARPHTVYHAAAYKHVTVTEVAVVAAARTNVLGTAETFGPPGNVGARCCSSPPTRPPIREA